MKVPVHSTQKTRGRQVVHSLVTYSATILVEFNVVVEEDVLLLDRLSGKLQMSSPGPATAGETHDGS